MTKASLMNALAVIGAAGRTESALNAVRGGAAPVLRADHPPDSIEPLGLRPIRGGSKPCACGQTISSNKTQCRMCSHG